MNGKSFFSFFNIKKIVSGASSAFSYFNKAIPIYKEMKPIVANVKNTISSYSSIKNAAKEASFKEIKSFERPKTIYKKNIISERGKINLDTLTFFASKKS